VNEKREKTTKGQKTQKRKKESCKEVEENVEKKMQDSVKKCVKTKKTIMKEYGENSIDRM